MALSTKQVIVLVTITSQIEGVIQCGVGPRGPLYVISSSDLPNGLSIRSVGMLTNDRKLSEVSNSFSGGFSMQYTKIAPEQIKPTNPPMIGTLYENRRLREFNGFGFSITHLPSYALTKVYALALCSYFFPTQYKFCAVRMNKCPSAAAIDARTGSSPIGIVARTLNSSPAESTTAVPRSLMQ